MRIAASIALSVTLVFAAAPAGAATSFLTAEEANAGLLLPPPPAQDSAAEASEIAELKAIAAQRTPAEFAAATADAKDESGAWFKDAIGPGFDFAKLPATAQLLADIHETEEVAAKGAKAAFQRERPYVVAPDLDTCTPKKPGSAPNSYPSGHSTVAFAMGVTLARLMPDKAQAILARAELFAERRLICGVHFRSDIKAGEAFGTAIAILIVQKPEFRKEYDAAAAELAAAHLR